MNGPYNRWPRVRDDLLKRLHRHAEDCALCRVAAGILPGVYVHNECEHGILLLTEWHLAKCNAETFTTHPPTDPPRSTPL